MSEILIPLTFEDLPTKPPLVGRPRISEDLQQTVALLVGWDGATRRLVGVSPSGVLYVTSPRVKGIANVLADQASYTWQGGDIPISEVLVRSHPDNSGRVWVNVGAAAAANTGYPLDSGEWVNFAINNLHTLHLFIASDTEKAIVIYTK